MLTKKFIYAVINNNVEGKPLVMSGTDGINAMPLEIVYYRDLAAVVSSIDVTRFDVDLATQERLNTDLLKYQQVNTFLLGQSSNDGILPLKFGFTASNKQEVVAVLERAYLQLRAYLDRLKGAVELVIQASWDISKTIQEIAHDHPELISEDPVQTGKRLFEATEARKKSSIDAIHQQLSPLAKDHADGPHKTENMLLNRSYLVEHAQEASFDAAMNKLGNEYDTRLSFRYIGPLPAYSFVNIELNQGNFTLLDSARKILQLAETATWEQTKSTYRQLLLAYHPDRNPNNPQAAQHCKDIVAAYDLVSAYYHSFPDFVARGNEGKYSFAKDDVEKAFIIDTKGAVLATIT